MKKRRQIELFSISFLDLLSGALGAVIILYVAIPKNKPIVDPKPDVVTEALEKNLQKSADELAKIKAQLAEAKEKLALAETSKTKGEVGGKNVDIGFKFKGKEILFIIDTSYSMIEEDRMGQVKAGMKMLITSLAADYRIEVVRYPLGERAPFKTLWGVPKENTSLNQMEVFDFIYTLRPGGGTPTRDVLLFALENYQNLSDIVLLTDGAPTLHNSNKKDDVYDILSAIREINTNKVQINCIGVGSQMTRDKTSDRYKFLSALASESAGFFVGF
ncbi:MAG: VWA domain-containing protein [Bdellovibrionales bacterium]|nr:VWA domain-containing protein [Bdellovibrionales bacterium]